MTETANVEAKEALEKIKQAAIAIERKRFSREDFTFILASFFTGDSPQELEYFLDDFKKQANEYKSWLKKIGGSRHAKRR